MLPLTVNAFGYVEIDTDDWLSDITTTDAISERLTEEFVAYCNSDRVSSFEPIRYADSEIITNFLRDRYQTVTGIYGDNGPAVVGSTYNEDNFLSDDIGFIFAHCENENEAVTLLIRNVTGYMIDSPERVEFFVFTGDDDADAFSYSSGYAAHADNSDECAEWIIESACTLWPNGGGESYRISEYVQTDEDGNAFLACPLCSKPLNAYTR